MAWKINPCHVNKIFEMSNWIPINIQLLIKMKFSGIYLWWDNKAKRKYLKIPIFEQKLHLYPNTRKIMQAGLLVQKTTNSIN